MMMATRLRLPTRRLFARRSSMSWVRHLSRFGGSMSSRWVSSNYIPTSDAGSCGRPQPGHNIDLFGDQKQAPVAGPSGFIHDDTAPADTRDSAAIYALRSLLPQGAVAFAGPARRTLEAAIAWGSRVLSNHRSVSKILVLGQGSAIRKSFRRASPNTQSFGNHPLRVLPLGEKTSSNQMCCVRERLATPSDGDGVPILHSGIIRAVLATAAVEKNVMKRPTPKIVEFSRRLTSRTS